MRPQKSRSLGEDDLTLAAMADGTWDVYRREDKVVLVIRGHYSLENVIASANAILELFAEVGRGEFLADFTDASGFDKEGRQHWQGRLRELATYVHTVSIVNGPPLMRMAAAAVCLYAGIKMRTPASLEAAFAPLAPSRAG